MSNNTLNNYGLSSETLNLLNDVFRSFPEIEMVKIFGSRAMGNYRPGSDIDLVIISRYLSHEEHLKILNALEDLELLYEIDCLIYRSIKEPALKEHIDDYGKILYKA
ncbi:nucleotidyltransferase domain-containing protein [Salinimicrobium sp. GXAS 041]|uniref:nucleotidyltransferase domain-containing protein n=1 Tax=Salinimicrobium sp. GXAS 041 TaxID=3400806 RepID=UPI003C707F44